MLIGLGLGLGLNGTKDIVLSNSVCKYTCDKQIRLLLHSCAIVHFTVVCLVAKPLNRSEAKGDLVMIQTLLLLKCKLICYHAN